MGPWEKVSQNIDPFKNHFFVTNYQYWTGTSVSQPFLTPPYPRGGLGGPGGVWGGLPTPKLPLLFGDQFKPWNAMFWVKTTCNTMFLRFGVKWGPPGSKRHSWGTQKVQKRPFGSPRRSSDSPRSLLWSRLPPVGSTGSDS